MSRIVAPVSLGLLVVLLATGCRTDLALNFVNGTAAKVWVTSCQTGRQVEVGPARSKKLPHSSGDLLVTTGANEKLRFADVSPVQVDRKFWGGRDNIVGPDSVVLSLRLETNMQLYVLIPGKKVVDEKVPQPKGYPKAGQKVVN